MGALESRGDILTGDFLTTLFSDRFRHKFTQWLGPDPPRLYAVPYCRSFQNIFYPIRYESGEVNPKDDTGEDYSHFDRPWQAHSSFSPFPGEHVSGGRNCTTRPTCANKRRPCGRLRRTPACALQDH